MDEVTKVPGVDPGEKRQLVAFRVVEAIWSSKQVRKAPEMKRYCPCVGILVTKDHKDRIETKTTLSPSDI